jgi:hypothetical protein
MVAGAIVEVIEFIAVMGTCVAECQQHAEKEVEDKP